MIKVTTKGGNCMSTMKGTNYNLVNVGELSNFTGKTFVKEMLETTGVEISFGSLGKGESVPFFHHHTNNEEVYIVLNGNGEFVIDGDIIPVESGSVIRISPIASRCTKNTGEEPLVYICIQAKEGSLGGYTQTDAVIEE